MGQTSLMERFINLFAVTENKDGSLWHGLFFTTNKHYLYQNINFKLRTSDKRTEYV